MSEPDVVDRRTNLGICLLLAVLTTLVYARVVFWGFIPVDDPMYVQEHPRIWRGLTLENIRWAFTTHHFYNWHPLTWLSYMLDCQVAGPRAGWLHLVNLAFHVADSVLLYVVLERMTRAYRAAAFVALMFALHPLHVESVAWISERKDVLSTLFWILCMGAYTGYARAPSLGRYALVGLTLALGLMAKSMLVTLPCVLLLLDYWPLDRFASLAASGRSKWRIAAGLFVEKIPLFALSAFASWMTAVAQAQGGAMSGLRSISIYSRMANAAYSYVAYLGQTFWPLKLGAYYPHPAYAPPDYKPNPQFYTLGLAAGAVLFVASVLFLWFGRDKKYLTVGWLWYLGTLVPVIGLVQVGRQGMADRYTYVPLIGIFIMLAWGVPDLLGRISAPARRFCLDVGCTTTVAVCLVLTWFQVGYWRSGITLFAHTEAVTENNVRAKALLALSYTRAGDFETAVKLYREVTTIEPRHSRNIDQMGVALIGLKQYEEAVKRFRDSIALEPDFASSHANCGVALAELKRYDEAVAEFQEAVRLEPMMSKAHLALGMSLAKLKRYDEAAKHYNEALRINPWQRGAQRYLEMANAKIPFTEAKTGGGE